MTTRRQRQSQRNNQQPSNTLRLNIIPSNSFKKVCERRLVVVALTIDEFNFSHTCPFLSHFEQSADFGCRRWWFREIFRYHDDINVAICINSNVDSVHGIIDGDNKASSITRCDSRFLKWRKWQISDSSVEECKSGFNINTKRRITLLLYEDIIFKSRGGTSG